MKDFILILVLAVIIGSAAWYVYRAKKKGVHCIGCPDGATCSGCCHSSKPTEGEGSCGCENDSCGDRHS